MSESFNLQKSVIDPGYCIGCGLCSVMAPAAIDMRFNREGYYQAFVNEQINDATQAAISRVCPFSDAAPNEDSHGEHFHDSCGSKSEYIGRYISCHAIRVVEGAYRENGSSAGFTSWLLCELLKRGMVDAVLHVGAIDPREGADGAMFGYRVSQTVEEVAENSRTKYHPIELSSVLKNIPEDATRYAVTGLPCFIKGIQSLRREDPRWKRQITYTVSLFCGHLKSKFLTENLIWGATGRQDAVDNFRYRTKLPGQPSNKYIASMSSGRKPLTRDWNSVFGAEWATGFFKYNACNFCDDVVGESADVSIGDAWLKEFVKDPDGTNNVVIRSSAISRIVMSAVKDGRLWNSDLTEDDVLRSTAGGFRDRREGLRYRLWLETKARGRAPVKRVQPAQNIEDNYRRQLYALKMIVSWLSPKVYLFSKALGARAIFVVFMAPFLALYKKRWLKPLLRLPAATSIVILMRKLMATYLKERV